MIFAVIAAFVLFQLYNVLGKRVGRQPQEDARGVLPATDGTSPQRPALDAVTMAAISGLKARDPAFDPSRFLEGLAKPMRPSCAAMPLATAWR